MQTAFRLAICLILWSFAVNASIAQDEPQRELSQVGTALSLAWSKGGKVYNNVSDFRQMAVALGKAKVTRPELLSARLKYFGVVAYYETAAELRFHQVTEDDIKDTFNGFAAGLSGDIGDQAAVILKAMNRASGMARQERDSEKMVGVAVKKHVEIWRTDMLPVVKELAGKEADFQPFRVAIERGMGSGKTGIKLRNVTSKKLTNVTVMMDSTLGSANEGKVTHFVFLPNWSSFDEISFPWRLSAGITEPGSNPQRGDTITFSMWSAEHSLTKQSYQLPADLKMTSKPAFRLNLVQDGGPTGSTP